MCQEQLAPRIIEEEEKKEYVSARHPMVTLIEELTKKTDCRQIYIQKENLSLRLIQHPPSLPSPRAHDHENIRGDRRAPSVQGA